jgi:serine/threonine-protein kinase
MTTGASNDFERATHIARDMVMRYGMSEALGPMVYAENEGEVFLGRDPALGREAAIKTILASSSFGEEAKARFEREARSTALLNHPNIVKVYDVSVNDDLQYIVMEYVDGMTLREYLNQRGGRLTNRETVHFISQILKALEHAHANGVVHRDIKPQNIMLLDNGQLRMMDFGISWLFYTFSVVAQPGEEEYYQ